MDSRKIIAGALVISFVFLTLSSEIDAQGSGTKGSGTKMRPRSTSGSRTKTEANGWETDFEKASATARKSGKYMLLDFAGSDWCGWCIKLEREVFSKDEFKKYADEKLVCVLVDFPRRKMQSAKLKEQNAELAEKYGIRGYPTVIILDPEGKLVGKTGYQAGGPEKYVEHLQEIIGKHKAAQ